jgi:hypothetical protein
VHGDYSSLVRRLCRIRDERADLYVAHYACASLTEAQAGPAAVSAVGFIGLQSDEAIVYSVADRGQEQELYVLESAFAFLREHSGATLCHWRMGSTEFGFRALANRLSIVSNRPAPGLPGEDSLVHIPQLISMGYGADFADHPKLDNLIDLNALSRRHSKSGKEEAELFTRNEHAAIRRSLNEKLSHLRTLLLRLLDGELETKRRGRRVPFADAHLDSIRVVEMLAARFLDVARQIGRRHGNRPTIQLSDEYDYQDLVHALLRVFFGDVREEAYTPDYAGGASRVDFRLPAYRMAIELKHPKSFGAKSLADQLIVDTDRYSKIPEIRHLVCLVFDEQGIIQNPRGLETDLSKVVAGLSVIVRILDR